MDPITHTLLTYKLVDKQNSVLIAGVAPDLPWYLTYPAWLLSQGKATQAIQTNQWPKPPRWMDLLHNCTHSFVIVVTVAAILRLFTGDWHHKYIKAWLLHIAIDIPTHSQKNWGTKFLWPISNYSVDGIPWAEITVQKISQLSKQSEI